MNAAGFPDYEIQNSDESAVIPFNSGTADVNGCYWYMDGELEGWDSPDMRVTMLPKQGNDPGADGEFAGDLHYRGRTIKCKLIAACPSEAAREEAWYLISRAMDSIGSNYGIFLANEEVPKAMVIQRAGNSGQGKLTLINRGFSSVAAITADFAGDLPTVDTEGLIYLLEADVEMYAADPRKYSQTVHTGTVASSTVALNNAGNTATQHMVLNITAGISNLDITVDLTLTGAGVMVLTVPTLPASAPNAPNFPSILHVDFYNKRITSGSGDNYYYLRDLRYPWLQLPPGTWNLVLSGGLGDPDGSTVTWQDAWI